MNKVIIRVIKNLKKDVADCMDELSFTPQYKEIVIKPNVLSYLTSGSGFITDVKIVRAVIAVLLEKYNIKKIFVAESSYINADTVRSFRTAGYFELEKEFDRVKLVDLKKEKYAKSGFKIQVPEILIDKTLINMPVLKGHPQTTITCAVKNLKGLIRDEDKRNIHKWGLQQNLPLLDNFKPELVIVDATNVRETFGKPFPKKFNFNRIICGTDMVLTDKAACDLVGIDANRIPYLNTLLKKRPAEFELIGFTGNLAKWNPVIKVLNVGKVSISITSSCSKCWDNCLEAIRPGHIKRETGVIKDILTILSTFAIKGKVNLVAGSDRNLVGVKGGRIILCGDCAVKNQNLEGVKIKGCPPEPKAIRKEVFKRN